MSAERRTLWNEPELPTVGGKQTHVLLELGDHLGSTSVVLDQATGELVERGTYQAYGGSESDYRPERWKAFREDYRFTGKEEDVEVGLQYFGKRYYAPLLNRWVSADPLAVHASMADPNTYAYVHAYVLKATDPHGLKVYITPSVKDAKMREEILKDYQMLTRDKLSLHEFKDSAGKVGWEIRIDVQVRAGGDKADRALGTELLRTLIGSQRVLEMGAGPAVKKGLGPGFFRPTGGKAIGSLVMDYDWLRKNSLSFAVQDGTKIAWKRAPTFVVLAHELVHAYRNLQGVNVDMKSKETELSLPKAGVVFKTAREELETTGTRPWKASTSTVTVITENLIRKEQGLRDRKYYGVSRVNRGPVQYGPPAVKP